MIRVLVVIISLSFSSGVWAEMADRSESPTYNLADLVETSILGIFEEECGDYCVIGLCAHLRWSIGWSGIKIWTVISPRIRHAMPTLLVSSYDHPGREPFAEWRNTFGVALEATNELVVGPVLLGSPTGLNGGRAEPVQQDTHQSLSYKEVDILGHPTAIIPEILSLDGSIASNWAGSYQVPSVNSLPSSGDVANGDSEDWNIEEMYDNAMASLLETIEGELRAAFLALDVIATLDEIRQNIQKLRDLVAFIQNAMQLAEAAWRGSVWGNFVNPRFRVPNFFCPVDVTALQPHYLSYADGFWWRSGWPLTDGPISGSNHTLDIMNPMSDDGLPTEADGADLSTWGHMYPREGTVNNNHDAKTASVLAWRAMDVLKNDVRAGTGGYRVGVPLPDGVRTSPGKWKMIYPENKVCRDTPYYPDNNLTEDFMRPSVNGGYSWNYYGVYTCCSNTRGRFLGTFELPTPICMSDVLGT